MNNVTYLSQDALVQATKTSPPLMLFVETNLYGFKFWSPTYFIYNLHEKHDFICYFACKKSHN